MLLYDLTSTYFEGAMGENPKAKYGHSRDKRTDCLQVVIALVITTDGFPLAYEVMDGNTSDRTTLRGFLDKIEKTYGKAKRMWVMDRGIPTEEILQEMRDPAREIFYLVGTPKAKESDRTLVRRADFQTRAPGLVLQCRRFTKGHYRFSECLE